MDSVRFAVVGIGGFAGSHHASLRTETELGNARLVAVADIALDKFPKEVAEFQARGVRVYHDAGEMLARERGAADVVTLPVGIAAHAPLAVAAMEAGFDVLVEKPPAATVEDVDAMIAASRRTRRFCAVGFQYMSSPLLRRLKSLLVSGRLGDLREVACRAHWPRGDRYYARNAWAGRHRVNGKWVLDGPMNNALAHQVMNLLFLAGPTRDEPAVPIRIRAELYHVRDIGGEDTTTFVADTDAGPRLFFGVTHACEKTAGPLFRIRGTRGTVSGRIDGPLTVALDDGTGLTLEAGPAPGRSPVFANVIDYFRGDASALDCPVARTRPMTLAVNGAYESSRQIHAVPADVVRTGRLVIKQSEDRVFWVPGLDAALEQGWERMQTLSEVGVPWAVATRAVDLAGYSRFTGADLPRD